ncbi:hypothetical protein LUZ60_009394 [Juncus effusus]|nr:hypothetical protein LUZ60_009394 [Juncus effusus]
MKLHFKISLIPIICFFLLHFAPTGLGETLNWTCTCADAPSNNSSLFSNCSSSCQCINDKSSGSWNCTCNLQQNNTVHDLSCFTSCNCSSGASQEANGSNKKHSSNKGVLITLTLCIALTAMIALIGSVTCYFYRKDRLPLHSKVHTFDKYTSWSSRSNLISHNSSDSNSQVKSTSLFNPFRVLMRRMSSICRSERGDLPGVILRFSYVELEQATNKFSEENVIGTGGTSKVYRGQLANGRMVAVKKLRPNCTEEADFEFLYEIELISRLNHRHVVPLIGYCSENQGRQSERLLIFEYMSNGNLRECLDKTQNRISSGNLRDCLDKTQTKINIKEDEEGGGIMEWKTRVGIALGVARGLEYLHEAAAPRILHRDIKSTNILLDDGFGAKITDLGMAKRLLNDDNIASCSSSPARMLGTFGYFAPEYAIVGKASLKSDVFSFGVVLLELITGRQPINKSLNKPDESLVIWATARLNDSKRVVMELPDPLLKGNFPKEEMQIMAHLARECLQWDPESRPSMSEVVQILSTIDPDKSKKRNLPTTFFMSEPHSNNRTMTSLNRPPANSLLRRDMMIQATSTCTSTSTSGRWNNLFPTEEESDLHYEPRSAADLPSQFVQRLIMLSRSWRSPDDEAVDLTEPRLETFTQPSAFETVLT